MFRDPTWNLALSRCFPTPRTPVGETSTALLSSGRRGLRGASVSCEAQSRPASASFSAPNTAPRSPTCTRLRSTRAPSPPTLLGGRDLSSKRAKPSSVSPRKGGSGDAMLHLIYEANLQAGCWPAGGGRGWTRGSRPGRRRERGAHLRGGLDGVFTWICRRGQWRPARSALGHPASALVPGS